MTDRDSSATQKHPSGQDCPLCAAVEVDRSLAEGELAVAILDKYPVSPGHCLILPRRHVLLLWDLSRAEMSSLFEVLGRARELVDERFAPDGYNVGVNVGEAAGQTIGHVHVHLIPRYRGDDADPRGGVRWVLPERAIYWEAQ